MSVFIVIGRKKFNTDYSNYTNPLYHSKTITLQFFLANPPQNSTPNPTPTGNATTSSAPTSTPPPTIIKSCETKYTHNVYLCSVSTMAIENVKNKTVVVYTWLSNGVKNVEILLSQVFLHSTCSSKMVGSTIESKFIGNMSVLYFAGKKASYIRHCKKKSLCIY